MKNMIQTFRKYLQSNRIIYTDIAEDIVLLEYRGEELEKIPLACCFSKYDPSICVLTCHAIVKCTPEQIPESLYICNFMNRCGPSANVYIDEDYCVCAVSTLRVHREYFCEDIMKQLSYMAEVADATYMEFQEKMEKE